MVVSARPESAGITAQAGLAAAGLLHIPGPRLLFDIEDTGLVGHVVQQTESNFFAFASPPALRNRFDEETFTAEEEEEEDKESRGGSF